MIEEREAQARREAERLGLRLWQTRRGTWFILVNGVMLDAGELTLDDVEAWLKTNEAKEEI